MSPIDPENPSAPARQLRKTRHGIAAFGVDVFGPPLHGLILAEWEFLSDQDMRAFAPQPFVHAEVTRDIRFSGGSLAASTREDLVLALSRNGIRFA